MPKKQKNIKGKEAFHRRQKAANQLSELGLSLDDELYNVGIVIQHIGYSQLAFDVLKSVEQFCLNYVGVDICFIIQQQNPSLINPLCPVLTVDHLIGWKSPLITTDLSTTIDAINNVSENIYYYVYDLDFLQRWDLKTSVLNRVFNDPRITLITRHHTYKKIIEQEFGVSVRGEIMLKFDLHKIVRMILGERKNVRTNKN